MSIDKNKSKKQNIKNINRYDPITKEFFVSEDENPPEIPYKDEQDEIPYTKYEPKENIVFISNNKQYQ